MVDLSVIEPLLNDPKVVELMINRYDQIYVERRGKLELTDVRFDSEAHLVDVMRQLVRSVGRDLSESSPIVDIQLSDGTLINIVMPPLAADGTAVTMRKFIQDKYSIEELIGFGSLTEPMAEFLQACVGSGLNMIVAGGAGGGKTTVFNVLSGFINPEDRVVSVEHIPELSLRVRHLLKLHARPANIEGKGAIAADVLVRNALKMRPDRVILSEARGGEVLEMLQVMNTGIDGSMFTIHASGVRDALSRLEVMATMGSVDVPLLTIREQIASGVHVITYQQKMADGGRRMTKIAEVVGTQGGIIITEDIFEYDGQQFRATGYVPSFLSRLQEHGFDITGAFFS